MGIFDFFKKKGNNNNDTPPVAGEEAGGSDLFSYIKRYKEYIVKFIAFQQQGNYAPIAAYEKNNGEIIGFLYVMEDGTYSWSVQESVNRMTNDFESKLERSEIRSYAILYHSQFDHDDNHAIANNGDEFKAFTVSYSFLSGPVGKIGMTYRFEDDSIAYESFHEFTPDQNNSIFNTRLDENKDYFQDKEEIANPVIENEIGIKIKKSNTKDLQNTWCGIYGFESYRKQGGSDSLTAHFAMAMRNNPVTVRDNITISTIDFVDVSFKAVRNGQKPVTILPVIKTNYVVDVETMEIDEWENVDGMEAIVKGKGRDTFGLWFFATDYAENKDRYFTEKKLNINISGIVFVLDIYKKETGSELQFADDFTAYMPNNDLPNYACFDFIGELEDFKETTLLHDDRLKAYILKVRLITNSDDPNFFSIHLYVTQENMRFTGLTKGMKLTGMFQMMGQIADS